MGFLSKILPLAGNVASVATGNPAFAMLGNAVGGLSGGSPSTAGTAADPNSYIGIRLPGVKYPEGMQLVDYPTYPGMDPYPTLPGYGMAPGLPQNIARMPVAYQNATAGETAGMKAAQGAESAFRSAANPMDPRVLGLAKEEAQLLRNDQLRGIQDLVRANRREQSLGREGIFGGERGAENISRILTQGAQDSNLRARMNARGMLNTLGTNLNSSAGVYQNQGKMEQYRRDALRQDILNAVSQMREDTYARTGEKREDYLNKLNMTRGDILGAYESKNQNTLNAYNAEVNKILNALKINQGNSNALSAATGQSRQANALYDAQRYNVLGSGAGNILKTIQAYANGTPWMSPGNVNPQGGYY